MADVLWQRVLGDELRGRKGSFSEPASPDRSTSVVRPPPDLGNSGRIQARPVLYLRQPRRVATPATAPMIPTRPPLSNGRNTRSETHAAPATMAGIYYWIVIREGSPLLAAPAVLIMPFALRRAAPNCLGRPRRYVT